MASPIYGLSGNFPKPSAVHGPRPFVLPGWAGTPEWGYSPPALPSVLHVGGADLLDGTPIFDIKPYIPYCDCHTDALGGFTQTAGDFLLKVEDPEHRLEMLPEEKREAAAGVLSHDPRPSYQNTPGRAYGMAFADFNIRFTVTDGVLTIIGVEKS